MVGALVIAATMVAAIVVGVVLGRGSNDGADGSSATNPSATPDRLTADDPPSDSGATEPREEDRRPAPTGAAIGDPAPSFADDVAGQSTVCPGDCESLASAHVDHDRYGPGTLAIVGVDDATLLGITFRSDDEAAGVVWERSIPAEDLAMFDGTSDDLGHVFLAVSFGGPGSVPLVVVPTADGFDDLGTAGAITSLQEAPFGGSDYVSPFDDVDGDGVMEIVNVTKTCVDDCMDFTWSRRIWTWDGDTYVRTTASEPMDPPPGWE